MIRLKPIAFGSAAFGSESYRLSSDTLAICPGQIGWPSAGVRSAYLGPKVCVPKCRNPAEMPPFAEATAEIEIFAFNLCTRHICAWRGFAQSAISAV